MTGLWPAGWAPCPAPGEARGDARTEAAALILTVALPDALQRQAGLIRSAHLPEAAIRAPAHLTLFRHLPGLEQPALARTLRAVAGGRAPAFKVEPPARWDGRWVAPVRSPALDALRAELADRWHGLLTPPDLAIARLHISLAKGRQAPPALPPGPWQARGLLLWRHDATVASAAEREFPVSTAERGGPFWTPLVAVGFHG